MTQTPCASFIIQQEERRQEEKTFLVLLYISHSAAACIRYHIHKPLGGVFVISGRFCVLSSKTKRSFVVLLHSHSLSCSVVVLVVVDDDDDDDASFIEVISAFHH
jgi:hypothetical protein